MKKILYLLLTVIGSAGTIFAGVMFIMALRFGEFGRVLVYFMLAIVCVEVAVMSGLRIRNDNRI